MSKTTVNLWMQGQEIYAFYKMLLYSGVGDYAELL